MACRELYVDVVEDHGHDDQIQNAYAQRFVEVVEIVSERCLSCGARTWLLRIERIPWHPPMADVTIRDGSM